MKVVVALTGASGSSVGLRLIEELKKMKVEVFTLATSNAVKIVKGEEGVDIKPDYEENDFSSPLASSSQNIDACIVCPCSMKTLSAIANGYLNNLIVRVADNCLRMKKKLILCVRETPLDLIHVKNMEKIILAGGIVMPLNIAFYFKPKKINDLINFFVGKILDILDLKHSLYRRWEGEF